MFVISFPSYLNLILNEDSCLSQEKEYYSDCFPLHFINFFTYPANLSDWPAQIVWVRYSFYITKIILCRILIHLKFLSSFFCLLFPLNFRIYTITWGFLLNWVHFGFLFLGNWDALFILAKDFYIFIAHFFYFYPKQKFNILLAKYALLQVLPIELCVC